MKKILAIIFAITLLTGCTANNTTPTESATESVTEATQSTNYPIGETISETELFLFEEIAGEYAFSSGAGAWVTSVTLRGDGIFEGNYHDTDAGSIGNEYPNGTRYICNFDGNFTEPEKIDDYTYSMKLESIQQQAAADTEYIEDGIRYVHTDPTGFENADVFMVYLPGKPVSELPEEYLIWDPMARDSDTLDHIGLYNVKGETGFVQASY